jgi:DNA-binding CsgD family transcriptional regulator
LAALSGEVYVRSVLRGRRIECETLDRLMSAVRAGESRTLVLRGEPGVGKTALLDYMVDAAAGVRVARAAGVQSEMELAFAGLHQLCAPMLDRLECLPGPQSDALGTAFGLDSGNAPDRFLVGLAALTLLGEVAEERPLLCVIDDAQWLDRASAQALAFVARRMAAESLAMVFAGRESLDDDELSGLPQLRIQGLGDEDARALLDATTTSPLDERVRDRIVAETRGNPLALLELPRGLTAAELAGGFALPESPGLFSQIEASFQRRLSALPKHSRQLLLVAAAEPVGEPVVVWRAAARLGIGYEAALPAGAAGMLEFGARVRFRYPLVRSAVYQAATPEERRAAHRALAAATDPTVDPDRRAWHRARAATGPDESVATELERSADRAEARGGLAAAAAFLERAVELTPEPERRSARALAAARAKHQAGAFDAALALLATAEAGPLDELDCVRVKLLRAQIAFAVSRGRDAPPLLLEAARRLEPLDPMLARETYLEAVASAMFVGRLAGGTGMREVAAAARAGPPAAQPPRPADLLLDGLAALVVEGYAAGVPILKRALRAFCGGEVTREEELRWLWLACGTGVDLWDDEAWYALTTRHVQLGRETGALEALPIALNTRIGVHLLAGELDAAAELLGEIEAVSEATRGGLAPYGALSLAALQGREPAVVALIAANMHDIVERGEGVALGLTHWANTVLYNGIGRYADALTAAERASEYPAERVFATWARDELIEAAVRCGKPERAAPALRRLIETTQASGTEWALGTEARARALLSPAALAEPLYREAIDRLAGTRANVPLARAHLVYGEWLRRERRRLDAREHLRTAYEMVSAMGLEGFAARAERELVATGETARRRTVDSSAQLTAQETQIARLARDGLSNPEIGTRLFISPRTVEYHLHKVFAKLDIGSRGELRQALQ